ncbi:hypothetical protein CIPAW_12G053500 [Carya illinoinensis]|uniref:Uncharacterized protein n=1 Tax=Carya illinoinensis TaxID=32201 RepID=A0A8T1NPI1_CARIL|nr:hypothetical protein CIPAW_12G053500 [Carya illinoinensis]
MLDHYLSQKFKQIKLRDKLKCQTVRDEEHSNNGDVKAGYKHKLIQRRKHGVVARELLHRFGLCGLAAAFSISYILRKAKTFCHECCCDASKDSRVLMQGNEVMLIDPYFSFPVIPAHTMRQHDC